MKYTLIKWSSNWADEMDIEGFVIVTNDNAEKLKDRILSFKESILIYVGTNEEMEFEDGKELLEELEFLEISEADIDVFGKFFKKRASPIYQFGHTEFAQYLDEENWREILEERDDD